MGYIQESRAPSLHVEKRSESTTIYSDLGVERIEVLNKYLPSLIVSLAEADLRAQGKYKGDDKAFRDLVLPYIGRPEYLAALEEMATIEALVRAEEIEEGLKKAKKMLPKGYTIVPEKEL